MKRFIDHSELARDRRFVRQNNVLSTILADVEDNVEAVVEAIEEHAPLIENSVRGTAAEPLFERHGPGMLLVRPNEPMDPAHPAAATQLRLRLHGVFVGELQALEGAARSLWDFPDAPWEFQMNMARQCWDEARHVQTFEKLLDHVDVEPGMFPESTFLFECACSEDPAMRVAGVNRALEGLACDVFRDTIRYAEASGDETLRQAVDFVLADEITHVRFGSEWVREFTRDDPEYGQRVHDFRREVDRQFSFGGARSARKDASIPIAREDRLEAGFSPEELADLEELSARGPSSETLREALGVLRERHEARRQAG